MKYAAVIVGAGVLGGLVVAGIAYTLERLLGRPYA